MTGKSRFKNTHVHVYRFQTSAHARSAQAVYLYLLFVKGIWYTCIKTILFISQLFIFALLPAKNPFAHNWVSSGDRMAEIDGF